VSTIDHLSGTVDRDVAAHEPHTRIDAIAAQLGITACTVTYTYIDDDQGYRDGHRDDGRRPAA
jgi:hypothetical protein